MNNKQLENTMNKRAHLQWEAQLQKLPMLEKNILRNIILYKVTEIKVEIL